MTPTDVADKSQTRPTTRDCHKHWPRTAAADTALNVCSTEHEMVRL